jgi:hypothetical protein
MMPELAASAHLDALGDRPMSLLPQAQNRFFGGGLDGCST